MWVIKPLVNDHRLSDASLKCLLTVQWWKSLENVGWMLEETKATERDYFHSVSRNKELMPHFHMLFLRYIFHLESIDAWINSVAEMLYLVKIWLINWWIFMYHILTVSFLPTHCFLLWINRRVHGSLHILITTTTRHCIDYVLTMECDWIFSSMIIKWIIKYFPSDQSF